MRFKKWIPSSAVSHSFRRLLSRLTSSSFLTSYATLLDAENWPASEDAAHAAVAKERQEQAAARGPVKTDADAWDRQEYIIATAARIPVIKGIALSFKLGILKIVELLWKPSELKIGL